MDTTDRTVKLLIGQAMVRAYGGPSHDEPDEPCPDCGHMLGDHHTDARGCTYCDCEMPDAA